MNRAPFFVITGIVHFIAECDGNKKTGLLWSPVIIMCY